MTDPIADMIIRMKNATMVGKDVVSMPMSKMKHAIALKLKQRGLVAEVSTHGKGVDKVLEIVFARTQSNEYRFSDVRRISKPGMRVYQGAKDIRTVRGGAGAVVLSTPQGIMFGDEARKGSVGGEVLFEIW
jgi:small subunit ribosomal protein S8